MSLLSPVPHRPSPRCLPAITAGVRVRVLGFSEAMRVHPAPRKRNITFHYDVGATLAAAAGAVLGRQKKLRRLPHIFSKVLELPLGSDADVSIHESPDCFRFVAATEEVGADVEAMAIEIHPGVMKVVVRDGDGVLDGELELDRWRFRLPAATRPALATAAYVDGELVVTIPKGEGPDEGDDDEMGEGKVFVGLGGVVARLVAVQ